MTSSFTLALRGVRAELLVLAIRGKEELGQLYRFEVRVAAADDLAAEAVLGMPAELQLTVGSTTRHVTGIVTAHEVVSRRSDGRQVLRLRVEPRLAALKHRSHWRVFHDRAVEEVLAEVLGAVGASFAWRVSREATSYHGDSRECLSWTGRICSGGSWRRNSRRTSPSGSSRS